MKASGPRNERETSIVFNEESDTASVWTASEVMYRKLKKQGFELTEDGERHAEFKCLKSQVKFAKQRKGRPPSAKTLAALAKGRVARKRDVSSNLVTNGGS